MAKKVLALLAVCALLLTACSNDAGKKPDDKDNNSSVSSQVDANASEDITSSDPSDTSSDTPSDTSSDTPSDTSQPSDIANTTTSDKTDSSSQNENVNPDISDIPSDDDNFLIPVDKTNDTIPIVNTAERLDKRTGMADEEANTLRTQIINSKDSLDTSKGKVYYISRKGNDANTGLSKNDPWYSLNAYKGYMSKLEPGDTVLFERGGVYRGTFNLVSGVNYGAYGEGPKPAIYGSKANFTGADNWSKTDVDNIWICNNYFDQDVGTIVFNHGIAVGVKREKKEEVKANFDFWHDPDTAELYIYLEKNPGETFYDIEICESGNLIWGGTNLSDVIIENLSVKYHGGHGIAFGDGAKNITIRNCDIGWIGGSYLGGTERFGNGIQFWNNCDNILMENNWVYQIYDAGLTHQGGGGNVQSNITYRNNLVEYCTYAIEFFSLTPADDLMKNIKMEKNILRFAGAGWGMVRTNPQSVSLICAWGGNKAVKCENFVISDNIFDLSDNHIIVQNYMEVMGITYTGNTWYQKAGYLAAWFEDERLDVKDQATFEAGVAKIDSNPKLVKFVS